MQHLPTVVLSLTLAMAGCFGGTGGSEDAGSVATTTSTGPLAGLANNTTLPPPPPRYNLTGCKQLHTFSPFPEQAIVPPLPPGFEPVVDGTGMVSVFINAGTCDEGVLISADGNRTFDYAGELQLYVPVTPPADLRDPAVTLDLVPLVAYFNSEEVVGLWRQWTFDGPVEEAGFGTSTTTTGTLDIHEVRVTSDDGIYEIGAQIQPMAGPEFNALYHVWLTDDAGGLIGQLNVTVTGGIHVGEGQSTYRWQNPGSGGPIDGGPPLWPGQSHVVSGATVAVEHAVTSQAEG